MEIWSYGDRELWRLGSYCKIGSYGDYVAMELGR